MASTDRQQRSDLLRIFSPARPAAAIAKPVAALAYLFSLAANALLPPADVECCQRKDFSSERCARFELSAAKCEMAIAGWIETHRRFEELMSKPQAKPQAPADASPASALKATFRGKFFEVRYPAGFSARPIDAARAEDASAATFTAPDNTMSFYVFSPQWGGDAPGLAPIADDEIETERRAAKGHSSGVPGTFTWFTITTRDKRRTRTYQDFLAEDKTIHWVIGMTYKSADALARYKAQYADFKASLRQFAD